MISQPLEFVQLAILVLALGFLVVAVEHRRLALAIIAFAVGNGLLSLLYFVLGAPYVAVFNFSVFSGAIAILFLATMSLATPEEAAGVPEDESGTEVTA